MSKRRLPIVSATQIQRYKQCARLWYILHVLKIRPAIEPERFVFGTRSHSVAQDLLEGNTPKYTDWEYEVGLGFAELTKAAMDRLEACEWSFSLEVLDAAGEPIATLRGKADAAGYRENTPVIVDHKTASNPAKDAETCEELRSNPQTVIYAYAALDANPAADRVILHWHWLPKKRRANVLEGAEIAEVVFTRAEAEAAFEEVCVTIEEMLEVGASETPPPPYFQVTPDPLQLRCLGEAAHCYPCDFVGECEDMSFLSKVKNQSAEPAKPAVSLNPDPNQRPGGAVQVTNNYAGTPAQVEDKAAAGRSEVTVEAGRAQRTAIRAAREILEENGIQPTADAILGFCLGVAYK